MNGKRKNGHKYIINEKFTDLKGNDNEAYDDTGGKDDVFRV